MTLARPTSRPALCACLSLIAIWLFTHRYHGLRHDSLFYAAQALARLDPPAFRHDLFFIFGSQDDFSLFSIPYAVLVERLGLGYAALLLLALAQAAWMLATAALARAWLHGAAFWLGLAVVFALPRDYGSSGDLHYAEPFLTARSWAEPLVIATLAAQVSGHRLTAWICALLAGLCHPIMALPGFVFLACHELQPNIRQLLATGVAATVGALLLPTMDAEWLMIARHRAPFLFLDTWQISELLEPLTWIGILAASARLGPPTMRRPAQALALTGVVCMLLALLGTETQAVLLIQTQPWRGMWLTKVSGLLALVVLCAWRWRRTATDRWLLAGLIAAAATATTLGGPVALALAVLAHKAWSKTTAPALPRWLPLVGGIALGIVALETLLAVLQQMEFVLSRTGLISNPVAASHGDLAAFLVGPLAVLLPLGLWVLLALHRRYALLSTAVASVLCAVSLVTWDKDTDPYRLRAVASPRPFGDTLPRTALVYWQHDFRNSWFLLRQGNYASIHQSVGVVFSRESALEARRRLGTLARFGATDGELIPPPRPYRQTAHPPTRIDLEFLCREPLLDYAILDTDTLTAVLATWTDPGNGKTWYLYPCTAFRPSRAATYPHPPPPPPPAPAGPPRHPPAIAPRPSA